MNQNSQQHSRGWRWLRVIGWTLAVLLLLIVLLRLSLKTAFVQDWAKNYLVSTANQQLNATLMVDRLSGDLWNNITLSDISLTQKDTTARIDSVHAEYNLWALIDGQIEVSQLGIYQPHLRLRQEGEQWNVQQILPQTAEDTSDDGGAVAFAIDDLHLRGGYISVQSDSIPEESFFTVNNLAISSSLAFAEEDYDINLRDLSFQLYNTQLDDPIRFESSASADQNQITLDKLVLATGNSVLQTSGYATSPDSTVRLDFSASPASWQDIARYARDFPLQQDVQIDLGLQGNPEQFTLTLDMQAPGLDSFEAAGGFQWKSGLILQRLDISADYFDGQQLLADTTIPALAELNAKFSGRVDVTNYQQGRGDLEVSARDISHSTYQLDLLAVSGSLEEGSVTVDVEAHRQNQQITANVRAGQIWSDLPSVKGNISGSNIDPEYWMQDTTLAGNLSFQLEISGRGWYPQEAPWKYSLTMDDSELMGQRIDGFTAKGRFNQEDASLQARLPIGQGMVSLRGNLRNMTSEPSYDYNIETRDLDVGPLINQDDFSTALDSKIEGTGRGFDPEAMQINTSISIDSSLVNGELIRTLSADLAIRDRIALVEDAQLQSTMAEGTFDFRFNLLNRFDVENELALDVSLRDLSALAPLADAEYLQAEGNISGKLTPAEDANLRFVGNIDLSNVQYNELFVADGARGSLDIRNGENIFYTADLDLSAPSFSGVQLQDLSLKTKGNYAKDRTRGSYEFQFSGTNDQRIEQEGYYNITSDTVEVRTVGFNFISDYRTLTLEKPFELLIQGDTLRMDTMRVSSGDGAFLEMGIPLLTSNEQRGFVEGQALNMEVIQSSLLGRTYFEGMLSGRFNLARQDTDVYARGQMLLSDISYDGTEFDSLMIAGSIADERLDGTLSLRKEGQELMAGNADLPFKLGDPEEFPDSFFADSVDGSFQVHEITIERFQSLFAEAGIEETSGIFSFSGRLDGTAGDPEFSADATLKQAVLSGVSIDSVTAGMDYNHEDATLQLDASVMSLKQKAAEINARLPLFIDMKTFQVDLPQQKDSIAVDIETNDFNLKAVNDFLDRFTVREVGGRLNGRVHITGMMEDLKTDGRLELSRGAFRLIPAGIRIDNIRSTVNFDPNQIRLTDFSARSGNGNLKASGVVELEKLIPGDLDIKIKAENFRAANTPQYNAIINLDARAQGQVTKPKITGSLDFVSGFLNLQNFGEKSVENVDLDTLENAGPEMSLYDSLALEMDVNFNRRFYIRNQRYLEMEFELAGELDLVKSVNEDLELFGTMNAPSGYARPFGKQFDLEEGSVMFNGPPANPELAIRTRYEPLQTEENIIIWYIIEGTVENPQFKYESQPPMELENIISYTIFGQPFYALDSWQQVVAGSGESTTAADVALDVLLDRVETLATQKLGIDVVRIDNTHVGGETGTSITTGWYINPKVFFAIQNVITGSTPDTGFLLEYMLRENLKLIIQQGDDIRQGIDLKWNYEY